MSYPGGKAGEGVAQAIINQIPPHETYVEGFAGGAAVLLIKKPAKRSVAFELDGEQADRLRSVAFAGLGGHAVDIYHGSFFDLLEFIPRVASTFVYLDPPYLLSTRSAGRRIYRCELEEPEDHEQLLSVARSLAPCRVMISGYRSKLYDRELALWRRVDFQAMTRGGLRTESLWMNYPEPFELHDYRFLGRDFRERQDIKRQQQRWATRLSLMEPRRRQALLAVLEEFRSGERTVDGELAAAASAALPLHDRTQGEFAS